MTQTLVDFIKAHALAHYEDGGWDVVVECYNDSDIADTIKGATNEAEAIEAFAFMVDVWADRQADARNSAF